MSNLTSSIAATGAVQKVGGPKMIPVEAPPMTYWPSGEKVAERISASSVDVYSRNLKRVR